MKNVFLGSVFLASLVAQGAVGDVMVKTDIANPQANKELKRVSQEGSFTIYKVAVKKGDVLKVEAG